MSRELPPETLRVMEAITTFDPEVDSEIDARLIELRHELANLSAESHARRRQLVQLRSDIRSTYREFAGGVVSMASTTMHRHHERDVNDTHPN